NPKGMHNYLLYYQKACANEVLGPFEIKLQSSRKYARIVDIKAMDLPDLKIEWRPVFLFSEDFMAF
ncbi:unnamed protein product, partial [marine sediment metagenome]